MSDLYHKMKARGVDMGWYERGKRGRSDAVIPLDDQQCSLVSIYLLKANGELWTVTHDGAEYQKVRTANKQLPKTVYICMHCKEQWDKMPVSHPYVPEPTNNTLGE